jgi:biopolymer transport protein ExbB
MNWFMMGGFFMWPLLICSLFAAFCILERLWFFTLQLPKINRSLESICTGKPVAAPPAGHLANMIARAAGQPGLDSDLLDLALERDLIDAERRLTGLNIVAQIAPLLGLLGTVTGLINAFRNIQAAGAVNPSVLAGGIWEALLATVAGLCIAIPSLIAYVYFSSRVGRWENHLQSCIAHAVRQWEAQPGAGAPHA